MSYRDREINFARIVGTAVATGSDQEDSIDLSDYGVQMGAMMGMRIWRVEFGVDVADALHDRPAQGALEVSEITLRTISSGTTPPEFTDDGVVAAIHVKNQGANTTSGPHSLAQYRYGTEFPKGLLIVSDRLYCYFNNNTGNTTSARARIWFTLEKMSESDWREAFEVWRRA